MVGVSTMIVYRIEHPKTKLGPWTHEYDLMADPFAYNRVTDTLEHARDLKNFPPLWKILDDYDVIPAYFTCGCESLAKLYTWFPEQARKVMRKTGFHLRSFSCKDIEKIAGNQVVFNRDTAIMLSSKPLR